MKERLQILESIEAGEISAQEGIERLEALQEVRESPAAPTPPDPPPSRPAFVRVVWQAVLIAGMMVLAWGGYLLVSAYTQEGTRGQTWGWILLVLGVLSVTLGWWLQRARWFYLRLREQDGANVTIALPIPLGLAAWGLRIAEPFVPQLRGTGVESLIVAMQTELRDGRSFVVEVDDEEDDTQVEIYFC